MTDVDLNAVWGTSVSDIWAAGDAATLMHFDGTAWSRVDVGHLVEPSVDFVAMTGTPSA